jgi:hypothetical protein
LKHDFGRFGLALEADAAQIASDQRSDGISMFDLPERHLRQAVARIFAQTIANTPPR